jgi:hypothetical protein
MQWVTLNWRQLSKFFINSFLSQDHISFVQLIFSRNLADITGNHGWSHVAYYKVANNTNNKIVIDINRKGQGLCN